MTMGTTSTLTAEAWLTSPDLITHAIRVLSGSVIMLGGGLVGTLLYIWNGTKSEIVSLNTKIDRIATGLEALALTTQSKLAAIEVRCDERHTLRRRVEDRE